MPAVAAPSVPAHNTVVSAVRFGAVGTADSRLLVAADDDAAQVAQPVQFSGHCDGLVLVAAPPHSQSSILEGIAQGGD